MKREKPYQFLSYLLMTGKVLIAGIVAFCILNLFAFFYYNVPSRTASKTGSTDFARVGNDYYFKMTEGFGYGKTDAKGFNNIQVIENPDILILGSSQTEGYNVQTEQNLTAVLNRKFEDNGSGFKAYNIGVSGHNFGVCLNNLGEAYQEFKPSKYVVIESPDFFLTQKELTKLQNGTFPRDDTIPSGITGGLQQFDYLRLLYLKFSEIAVQGQISEDSENTEWNAEYINSLDAVLKTATEEIGDCRMIILSSAAISLDGVNILERENEQEYELFRQICSDNNIIFLDTYEDFAEFYYENHVLPLGFSNTQIDKGHLNEHGHRILGEKLYQIITETEEAK